jgi:hypothetical protein
MSWHPYILQTFDMIRHQARYANLSVSALTRMARSVALPSRVHCHVCTSFGASVVALSLPELVLAGSALVCLSVRADLADSCFAHRSGYERGPGEFKDKDGKPQEVYWQQDEKKAAAEEARYFSNAHFRCSRPLDVLSPTDSGWAGVALDPVSVSPSSYLSLFRGWPPACS